MPQVAVNRITNARVYIDGNVLLGQVAELDMPDIQFKFSDYKALGMVGSAEFVEGIDKLTARVKFNSLYPDVLSKAANIGNVVNMLVYADQKTYGPSGMAATVPVLMEMSATFKSAPMGKFKQHESIEAESELAVYYAKLSISGVPIFEIDVLANIYSVNGVPQNF